MLKANKGRLIVSVESVEKTTSTGLVFTEEDTSLAVTSGTVTVGSEDSDLRFKKVYFLKEKAHLLPTSTDESLYVLDEEDVLAFEQE